MNEHSIEQPFLKTVLSRHPDFCLGMPILSSSMDTLKPKDVLFLEAKGNLTSCYFANNIQSKVLIDQSISLCYETLKEYGFYQVHRSFVVNLTWMMDARLVGEIITFPDGRLVKVSRRNIKEFRVVFNELKLI